MTCSRQRGSVRLPERSSTPTPTSGSTNWTQSNCVHERRKSLETTITTQQRLMRNERLGAMISRRFTCGFFQRSCSVHSLIWGLFWPFSTRIDRRWTNDDGPRKVGRGYECFTSSHAHGQSMDYCVTALSSDLTSWTRARIVWIGA